MVSEPHDWTVPASLRALLWWPPLAFCLVLLEPSAAAGTIAATGAALAVLGAAGAAVRRVRRCAPPVLAGVPAEPAALAVEQRAA